MRRQMGRTLLVIALGGVLVVLLSSCSEEDRLEPPFSDIIPSCKSTEAMQKAWFEHSEAYLSDDWRVEASGARACKGKDLKLWMDIYRFTDEEEAHAFVSTCDRISEIDEYCYDEGDWPDFLPNRPDEAYSYTINYDVEACFEVAIFFRVGRWAGKYAVQDTSVYGTDFCTFSPTAWGTLWDTIDETIPRLQAQP